MLSEEDQKKLLIINAGIDALVQCTMSEHPRCICSALRPLTFVRAEILDGKKAP